MTTGAALTRFVRSSAVGLAATAADLGSLALLVEALGVAPLRASVPALLAGAITQFVGNRVVAFGAAGGSWRRQLARFAAAELVALALNALVFAALVRAGMPYLPARVIGSFAVFAGVSFPLWHAVFPARERVASPR